ncbi:MAG: histidine kinase [Acidobacteria bacterium]|nr:histidine kinase [Acidobacteriota bacterium]
MFGYQFLFLISLVTFTFGALTFSVLAVSWMVWGKRTARSLTAFTALCAAAFVANLALWGANLVAPGSRWTDSLSLASGLATGLLPPVLLQIIWRQEESGLPLPRLWKAGLLALYVWCAATALARGLAPADLADRLESAPAVALGATSAAGLAVLFLTRRRAKPQEVRQRWWYRVLLALALASVAFGLEQAADYVLLAFFAVTLYYRERLVFFDVLIKRGAFFALALAGLTFFFATAPPVYERLPGDWSRPWICALLLMPLWLAAPWAYARLAAAIDHFWLGRPYAPAEAERQFTRDVQMSTDERELQTQAEESVSSIFQTTALVRFGESAEPPECPEDGVMAQIEQRHGPAGWVMLAPRPKAIPYLSDDRRLLQSLARTLGVVLENVRFREQRRQQEEREQELRLLASRAELKALRAQINPHFLFNALNAIAGLIPHHPELADETVEQLAQVFRYTLRKSEKEWARLDDEVEFAQAYLRVEQARFGARLRVEFDIEAQAQSVPIPAMSVQPLIENAVKHGVGIVEGPATVALSARVRGQELWVEVFDNGPGFPPGMTLSESNGHGLRNVAERLRGYYGDAGRLWWENGPDGTRVFLSVPRQGAAS